MANRFYTDLKERKLSGSGGDKSQPQGKKTLWNGSEKTANWKPAGSGAAVFNRGTKAPVVKQYARKQGVD